MSAVLDWCLANGHAVSDDGAVRLHHAAHHVIADHAEDLAPGVTDGLTWARLVEQWETWLGTRTAEGLTAPNLRSAPPAAPELGPLEPADVAGTALDEATNRRRLVARVPTVEGDPPPAARWTAYAGDHPLAFTNDECDHLLRIAGPRRRGESYRIVGIPHAGGRRWAHQRIGRAVELANAVWWRFELTATEHVQLLEYGPGDSMDEHTDASPMFPARKLSAVVLLSDPGDYEGGRLEFLHDPVPTAPPHARGTVVVFPATLLHRVTPITAGRRFAVTAFCIGPPLR